jgi:ABC-type multidrug transport system fused ATPase/permease subunit
MFVKRIFQVLADDRRLMVWSVLFGLLFTGLGIVPPLLVREMIRRLERGDVEAGFAGLALLIAGVYLLRGLTRYLYGLMSHVAAYRTLHRLMNAVYRHLQRQSPAFLNRTHTGNLTARTVGDVEAIEDFIAHGIPESMLAIVIPVTMSVVLLVINWKLALIALLPLPIVAGLVYYVTTRTRNHWKEVRVRFADLSARIHDHLSGLAVIQSFRREAEQARLIEQQSGHYRDSIIYANKWSLVPAGLIEAAAGGGLVLIVWATGRLHGSLEIDIADLVVFLMYLSQIVLPFLRLANLNENLQKAAASSERVFELLDTEPTIVDAPTARIPDTPRFDVEFAGVEFCYEPDLPVLRDVSFRIGEGETVALVGATGVGKTTACHLLVRFFEVTGGVIRLGGHDLRTLPLDYLRQNVGLVSQDVFLFEGTVRENLRIGRPDASDDELRAAAKAANAEEFVLSFPDGYDTLVGERGVRLSGGQKQRIAIARAVLKNAPVLVLDEATSAVDAETENLIRRALDRLTEGRTVLVIAHRLSTIMAADRIIVLDEGRVIETGTYEELAARNGHFTRLCRLQENALW